MGVEFSFQSVYYVHDVVFSGAKEVHHYVEVDEYSRFWGS
jgi:hypothetical protein